MIKKLMVLFLLLSSLLSSSVIIADEYDINQQHRKFTVNAITIKVGDTIHFKNNDYFFHNIYSLSDLENFNLGSFPPGGFRSYTFNNAGDVEVECAIHPFMKLEIKIEE